MLVMGMGMKVFLELFMFFVSYLLRIFFLVWFVSLVVIILGNFFECYVNVFIGDRGGFEFWVGYLVSECFVFF